MLDVLLSQASSVPCERLFYGTKQVATDRHACLGPTLFEELTIMNAAWGADLFDIAHSNKVQVDDVSLLDFEQMLVDDGNHMEWDKDLVASSTWRSQGPLRYEDL